MAVLRQLRLGDNGVHGDVIVHRPRVDRRDHDNGDQPVGLESMQTDLRARLLADKGLHAGLLWENLAERGALDSVNC